MGKVGELFRSAGTMIRSAVSGVAVSRDSFPKEMFEHGWGNSLGEILGLGRPDFWFGRNAMALALAVMCADVKARDMTKADLNLYRRKASTKQWELVSPDRNEIAALLALEPSEYHLWPELVRMVVLHLELAHNAYLVKLNFRIDGTYDGLLPIPPARVMRRVSPAGKIFFQIHAGNEFEQAVLGTNSLLLPAEQVIHLRNRLWDGVNGMSSLALGEPIFDIITAIADYQRNIFTNDGQALLAFETDGQFADDALANAAFNRLKRQLTDRVQRGRANGDPILLEAGLKARIISITAKDSEAKDSFDQQVMRVCGLMNCPPHKIYALASVAYNNSAAMDRAYYTNCLEPLAIIIEQGLKNGLFPLRRDRLKYSIQFDRIKLMANDLESLTKILKVGMDTGLLTVDEGREALPFAVGQIAGGNVRHVPVNMTMIDGETGKILVQGNAGQRPNAPGSSEQGEGDGADDGENTDSEETGNGK